MKILDIISDKTHDQTIDRILPKTLICFSHLRWDFVFQRPQHLLTRLAKTFNIFYIEEPIFDAQNDNHLSFSKKDDNLVIIVPHITAGLSSEEIRNAQKALFDRFMENLSDYAFWYYTPMALEFSRKFIPDLIIFDCMDELSAFKFAPEELKTLEKELLHKADIVFTGGFSLFEAKKNQHANIHAFPSSIDKRHFLKARKRKFNPIDQIDTTLPKIGFYGVIDERFDVSLIKEIADQRPEWQIILIGPVVKINPDILPKNSNIHYLGPKSYQELPAYMASWDIALIPFLLNESTRYISPTKTPEYLAAGIPVVSTPIRDVVHPYGTNKLVHIAASADNFILACEEILSDTQKQQWLKKVDAFLSRNSWDNTCADMLTLINKTVDNIRNTSIAQ